jgi:hypothetical protein
MPVELAMEILAMRSIMEQVEAALEVLVQLQVLVVMVCQTRSQARVQTMLLVEEVAKMRVTIGNFQQHRLLVDKALETMLQVLLALHTQVQEVVEEVEVVALMVTPAARAS